MDGGNNQPGVPGSPTGPAFGDGQDRVNPMSPSFAGPSSPGSSPMPNNPPVGGTPVTPPPPPPPPPPPSGVVSSGGPVPPPPPREVGVRTMASDQSSLRASGGMGVAPQIMKTVPGGPKKIDSIAKPTASVSRRKALFMGLGIIIFLAAAAAAANYLVIPFFFKDAEVAEVPADIVPIENVVTPTIPTFIHQSYFTEPVDGTAELALGAVTYAEIADVIGDAAAAPGAEGSITEFSFTVGSSGQPAAADEFIEAMFGDVSFATQFEQDFTGFLYSDGDAKWPGYVLAIASSTIDKLGMEEIFNSDFESSSQLADLFVEEPGTPAVSGFRDGMAMAEGGKARYLSFSQPGASLNYGWQGDFLVISTSFNGFKKAIEKLGDATAP